MEKVVKFERLLQWLSSTDQSHSMERGIYENRAYYLLPFTKPHMIILCMFIDNTIYVCIIIMDYFLLIFFLPSSKWKVQKFHGRQKCTDTAKAYNKNVINFITHEESWQIQYHENWNFFGFFFRQPDLFGSHDPITANYFPRSSSTKNRLFFWKSYIHKCCCWRSWKQTFRS